MVNDIEFIFWGTKRGVKVFFNSDGINPNNKEIQDTLKDVSTYYRSTDVGGENYYAIEYTQQQVVYTLYYTLYDWGNRPGFMAVTIYVPTNVQLVSPVSSLQKLFTTYREKYIGANYKITEERERKSYFDEIVSSFRTQPANYDLSPSPQNRKYGAEYFKSDEELEHFFTDPIRKEYFDYQEVLFLPESLRKDYQSLTPLNGNSKREYNLEITLKGHKEEYLSPEGLKVSINKNSYDEWNVANKLSIFPLSYQDQIEILFQKERYEKLTKNYKIGDLADSKEHCADEKTIKLTEKIEPIKKTYMITLLSIDGRNNIKKFKYTRNNQKLKSTNPLKLENVQPLDKEQITFSVKGYKEKSEILADKTNIEVKLQPLVTHKKRDARTNESSTSKFENIKPYIVPVLIVLILLVISLLMIRWLSTYPSNDNKEDSSAKDHTSIANDSAMNLPLADSLQNNLTKDNTDKKDDSNVEIDSAKNSEAKVLKKKTKPLTDQPSALKYQLELEKIIDFSETIKWSSASSNINNLISLKDKKLDFTKMNSKHYSSNDYDGLLKRLTVMENIDKIIKGSATGGEKNKKFNEIFQANKLSKRQNSEIQAYLKK
ncbi:hypothetical protein [Portibacter lacus]|uniref:Uncharacterized protein n=1 Tax=Portibacter lacus TaxID=1099794 RepID=A0AA37WDS2_9BACT|nr:hypothetical protein [Portibacter lacus]GLR15884.1 hypothetical protein GCM10007940_04990 [Portibacter lacus]